MRMLCRDIRFHRYYSRLYVRRTHADRERLLLYPALPGRERGSRPCCLSVVDRRAQRDDWNGAQCEALSRARLLTQQLSD